LEFLYFCFPFFCRAWGSNQVEAAIKSNSFVLLAAKPDDYFYGIAFIGPTARHFSPPPCLYLAPAGPETFPFGHPPFSALAA